MSTNTSSVVTLAEKIITLTNNFENEVNISEDEEINRLVTEYDVVLNGGIDEKDLIPKYETLYDRLDKKVKIKKEEIKSIETIIETSSNFSNGSSRLTTALNKKKDNANKIVVCLNKIVERIRKIKTIIYYNEMKELDGMRVDSYDKEMNIINESLEVLKKWSNKNNFNFIFDSKIDGDGSNNVLRDKVLNRSNLYFITFDENNNVYGGYINAKIDKSGNTNDYYVIDENAFLFSLIRNGSVNNKKYSMKQGCNNCALRLHNNNNPEDYLYNFSNDIFVRKVGTKQSWCNTQQNQHWYYYKNDNKPFTDFMYPNNFVVQRIMVIEMN